MPSPLLFSCEQCGQPSVREASAKFCPMCGRQWAVRKVKTLRITTQQRAIDVADRIGAGTTATLYRCTVSDAPSHVMVLKIARDASKNPALQREASALRTLVDAGDAAAIAPFVPHVADSFAYAESDKPPRQVNVLSYDPRLGDVAALYTLTEVLAAYPNGIDARDAAWMFRRLLHAISLAHAAGIAHGALVPSNILIEPIEHKLVIVGWSDAAPSARRWNAGDDAVAAAWVGAGTPLATSADVDIALAARTMIDLVGGNASTMTPPASLDAALARFLERCVAGRDVSGSFSAAKLLTDFDRLIEVLWGPRVFRPFSMPPRASVG